MQTNLFNQIKSLIEDSIPKWLSVKDAVRISGLSESSIRRAISSGQLKANKKGKWLIKSVWLEKYLTS
jgi:predicted transcriptional regulator of viral defense system